MKEFIDSPLLGNLAQALAADINAVNIDALPFPCRPLAAASAGSRTVLGRFRGAISPRNCDEFKATLADLSREAPRILILDLAEACLDKTAIGILMNCAADACSRDCRLYLFRPSEQIRAALRELGLPQFFSFLETGEDIIASLVL